MASGKQSQLAGRIGRKRGLPPPPPTPPPHPCWGRTWLLAWHIAGPLGPCHLEGHCCLNPNACPHSLFCRPEFLTLCSALVSSSGSVIGWAVLSSAALMGSRHIQESRTGTFLIGRTRRREDLPVRVTRGLRLSHPTPRIPQLLVPERR